MYKLTALEHALARTLRLHADKDAWSGLQKVGMSADVSWDRSARRYAALYRSLAA